MSRCTVPVNPAAACVHSARFGWLNLGGISLFLLAMALACRLARAGENDGGTVDFAESVLPILTKAGCNSGACHGAAAGRGYLNLSLYGSRPNQDYQAIVHAPGGRLLDLQRPEESLLLLKPGGFLDHGGDVRLDPESPAYSTVLRWLKSGAKAGSLETVRNIAILPQESIAVAVGQTARVKIQVDWRNRQEFAHAEHIAIDGAFPAGKRLDAPVQYLHELDQILLTASRPGYWPITIRVGPVARTLQMWVRPADTPLETTETDISDPTIDRLVDLANQRIASEVGDTCAPHLLVRRLWLDLLGRHPSRAEWSAATKQINQGQKQQLIEQLLAAPDFWEQAGREIVSWIPHSTRAGSTIDRQLSMAVADFLRKKDDLQELARSMMLVPTQIVDESPRARSAQSVMLSDEGPHSLNQFHNFANDPRSRSELVASVWLGVRIGCAQCHDHPLDHWTQDDYFSLAACWAEIESAGAVRRSAGRTTTDLRNGRPAVARLPGKEVGLTDDANPPDVALVQWITDNKNRQFSSNLANRIWFWLMGTGLVEDVDDQRATNPALNAELLDYLADTLVSQQYSLRKLVREIVMSDAYARQSASDATKLAQRMSAQRGVKAIHIPIDQLASMALGAAWNQASDSQSTSNQMMTTVPPSGCSRGTECTDPFQESMELVSGDDLNRLISELVSAGEVASDDFDPMLVLQKLHFRLFGIHADQTQKQQWEPQFEAAQGAAEDVSRRLQREMIEDTVWSWIVSDRFRRSY